MESHPAFSVLMELMAPSLPNKSGGVGGAEAGVMVVFHRHTIQKNQVVVRVSKTLTLEEGG